MVKFGIIVISAIAVILTIAIFYFATTLNNSREEMYYSQKSIEQSLADLNQTIEAELEYQKMLTDKVTELAAKADMPPPVINTTKIVQAPPTVVKVPSTTPAPVTRAS